MYRTNAQEWPHRHTNVNEWSFSYKMRGKKWSKIIFVLLKTLKIIVFDLFCNFLRNFHYLFEIYITNKVGMKILKILIVNTTKTISFWFFFILCTININLFVWSKIFRQFFFKYPIKKSQNYYLENYYIIFSCLSKKKIEKVPIYTKLHSHFFFI